MSKVVSISLVSLFASTILLPLFAFDACDLSCSRVIDPCCESGDNQRTCGVMAQGQSVPPVLFVSAPRPVTIKLPDYYVSGGILTSDPHWPQAVNWLTDSSPSSSTPHQKVPLYFRYHSLLI